jgi:arsenate reductase
VRPTHLRQIRPAFGADLPRRLLAEVLGTGLLATAVIGSGIMATRLAPGQPGLQLLANSLATVFGLAALILTFGPVSGAHFNPVVSAADWWHGRASLTGLNLTQLAAYAAAQTLGAIGGAILANSMFGLPAITTAGHVRTGGPLWLGEIVATAGLILLITALARSRRTALAPAAVAAYIGGAYWFTSSTSFANPAVTIGRAFSDTFAGIAPSSVPAFIGAQLIGLLLGSGLAAVLYPATSTDEELVGPHPAITTPPAPASPDRNPR